MNYQMLRTLLLMVGLLLSGAAKVYAHAIVVAAVPAAHSVVQTSTFAIDLRFNSRIDLSRSRLALIDAKGQSRVLGLAGTAESDRMRTTATEVAPGPYRLEWYVLSADGHITRGNLKFQVVNPR